MRRYVAIEPCNERLGFAVVVNDSGDGQPPNREVFHGYWDECEIIHDAFVRVGYASLVCHTE